MTSIGSANCPSGNFQWAKCLSAFLRPAPAGPGGWKVIKVVPACAAYRRLDVPARAAYRRLDVLSPHQFKMCFLHAE